MSQLPTSPEIEKDLADFEVLPAASLAEKTLNDACYQMYWRGRRRQHAASRKATLEEVIARHGKMPLVDFKRWLEQELGR